MKWTVTTAPAVEPITYAESKSQARIDSDDERDWVTNIAIPAVRQSAEDQTQTSLITRTITCIIYDQCEMTYADFSSGINWNIRLPRGPVQAIASVTDNNNSTVSVLDYELRRVGLTDWLVFKKGQKLPVTIVYTAGYGASAAYVPPSLRQTMLAHLTFLYENRSGDAEPAGLDNFYRRYRSFAG